MKGGRRAAGWSGGQTGAAIKELRNRSPAQRKSGAELGQAIFAKLASAFVKAGKGGGAILIAGNGHVRSERGVPWYLARQAAEAKISSVMLLEITDGATTVSDLVITGPVGEPGADYFWFTPRAKREAQCGKLRRRFGK